MPCAEIHSLSLRPLNLQAQSSLKCTYFVHLEGNLQSDIQEESGRRMKILRKEGASLTLYYAGHTESSKYLLFRSTGGWCGFIFSLLLASAFNHLPTLLIWPNPFNICLSLFSFFFSFILITLIMLIQRL